GGGPAAFQSSALAAFGQVRGGGEVGAMSRVDRRSGQRDREHGLTGAGWADEQHIAGIVEEPQRRQLPDQFLVDPGLGGEVELRQGGGVGQAGEPQPPSEPARLGGVDFYGQQLLQRRDRGELLGLGGVLHAGQRLGRRGQLEQVQMVAQPLIAGRLRVLHRGRGGGGHELSRPSSSGRSSVRRQDRVPQA